MSNYLLKFWNQFFSWVLRLSVGVGIGLFSFGFVQAHDGKVIETAKLKYSPACILREVADKMGVKLRTEISIPPVFLASDIPLKQFQDAIEPQWNFRPDMVTNAYIILKNEIYLIDELAYYQKTKRFIDDSLAHELAHFVQVRYQNADLSRDESLEPGAIDVQTWFRETYLNGSSQLDCSGLL